ncbi:hypothetical protein RYX36_018786 [Vicia faba]
MISWNCRLGNMKRAFALFDEMAQRNVAPNAHTYGALIGGVCKAGQMEAAEILLEEMQSKGIDLNMIIFNTMIDGYCKRGMMDEALRLQTIMERKGFNADVFTFNILANGLCKLHRYDEAKCTLNSMVDTSGTSLGHIFFLHLLIALPTPEYVTTTTILAAKFCNRRQTCVCANRILVQEGIYDKFANALLDAVQSMKVGDGFSEEAKALGMALGVSCLNGIEEAEAQCALLNSESLCDGDGISLP